MSTIRTFEVVNSKVAVRLQPKVDADAIGCKVKGTQVAADEETFDGWVHIVGANPGWMLRDMRGMHGLGQLLKPLTVPVALAAPELAADPGSGPQQFEVVYKPRVAVRAEPKLNAEIVGSRSFGEWVQAETQNYDGWVRLTGEQGWILARRGSQQLLICQQLEKTDAGVYTRHEETAASFKQTGKGKDTTTLRNSVQAAHLESIQPETGDGAEQELDESIIMDQLDPLRDAMRKCMHAAFQAGDEDPILECIECCEARGFVEEVFVAKRLLGDLKMIKSIGAQNGGTKKKTSSRQVAHRSQDGKKPPERCKLGRQSQVVQVKNHSVAICQEAQFSAPIRAARSRGAELSADKQASDRARHEVARLTLQRAATGKDIRQLQDALESARAEGVAQDELELAEHWLQKLVRLVQLKHVLSEFIEKAAESGDVQGLQECEAECTRRGFTEQSALAAQRLDELRRQEEQKHEALVALASTAAATGIAERVAAARDAALERGATLQEVARAYALGCSGNFNV